MIRLLEFIKSAFDTAFEVLRGFGGVISSLIGVLGKCVSFLGAIFSNLPAVFYGALTVLVIVCVLYKILGREGQD